MREDITLIAQGVLGNNQTANTLVAAIAAPGPGRYKVWGHCRHTLADGLKLSSPTVVILSGGPNDTIVFGPMVFDINDKITGVGVALNTATGASDTASATVYVERINH